jgi:hypothetical protein
MNLLAKKIKLHCARKGQNPARSGGFVTTVTHDAGGENRKREHRPISELLISPGDFQSGRIFTSSRLQGFASEPDTEIPNAPVADSILSTR